MLRAEDDGGCIGAAAEDEAEPPVGGAAAGEVPARGRFPAAFGLGSFAASASVACLASILKR